MIIKIINLEKKINDSRIFQGLEQMNKKWEKEWLLEDNKKLSNKVLELEEKLKPLEEGNDESNDEGSLILELENQFKTLNKRKKALNLTCAQLRRSPLITLSKSRRLKKTIGRTSQCLLKKMTNLRGCSKWAKSMVIWLDLVILRL